MREWFILQVEGVLHHVEAVDGDLRAAIRLGNEQHLLVQPKVPAVVRAGLARQKGLVEGQPQLGVVGIWAPRRLWTTRLALFVFPSLHGEEEERETPRG